MNFKNKTWLADAAVVVTCFFWGLNAVVTKNAIGSTPESFRAFIFNGLRLPACSFLLFLTVKISGGKILPDRRDMSYITGVSFFGMFLFMISFILGIYYTTVTNTGIINATTPLFILLISFLSKTEHPSKNTIAGIIIGFAGMLFVTLKQASVSFNIGDFLIIASCFTWGIHTVYGKKIVSKYTPIMAIAWIYLLTSIFQLPLFIYQLPAQSWTTISLSNWINLAISTVGSLYIANTLYYFSIGKIGPSRVGVYTNLTPVFTILLAMIIRKETVDMFQLLGFFIIFTGIMISKNNIFRKKA